MALKIEHECDLSGKREAVNLPSSGPLDLSKVPLPEGWVRRPPFPGGNIGPQDEVVLCAEAITVYDQALADAEQARDKVYMQAMARAKQVAHQPAGNQNPGKPVRSSSFAAAQ